MDPNPTLTFTLRSTNGLEIDFSHDHGEQGEKIPMLPLSEGTGKWIQVKLNNSRCSPAHWQERLSNHSQPYSLAMCREGCGKSIDLFDPFVSNLSSFSL